MIDSTAKLALVAAGPAADGASPDPSSRTGGGQGATRVYVDQDGSGVFIYRLVEVATGRVLVELPRERAGELKDHPDYAAGALVSTSA